MVNIFRITLYMFYYSKYIHNRILKISNLAVIFNLMKLRYDHKKDLMDSIAVEISNTEFKNSWKPERNAN